MWVSACEGGKKKGETGRESVNLMLGTPLVRFLLQYVRLRVEDRAHRNANGSLEYLIRAHDVIYRCEREACMVS